MVLRGRVRKAAQINPNLPRPKSAIQGSNKYCSGGQPGQLRPKPANSNVNSNVKPKPAQTQASLDLLASSDPSQLRPKSA